jgi:hypothetical protein
MLTGNERHKLSDDFLLKNIDIPLPGNLLDRKDRSDRWVHLRNMEDTWKTARMYISYVDISIKK